LSRHHHRRHSRRHRSNHKDKNYFISNEKSPIDSNYIDINANRKTDNTLWENTACINELDENKLECADSFGICNEQDSPENLPINNYNDSSIVETIPSCCAQTSTDCNNIGSMSFIDNLKKHTGKKTTIYTSGGDSCRCNFTGILIGVNHCFIRLVIKIGETPVYEPENNCNDDLNSYNDILPFDNCNSEQNCKNDDISTFVDIPIDKITSFIHSNI